MPEFLTGLKKGGGKHKIKNLVMEEVNTQCKCLLEQVPGPGCTGPIWSIGAVLVALQYGLDFGCRIM